MDLQGSSVNDDEEEYYSLQEYYRNYKQPVWGYVTNTERTANAEVSARYYRTGYGYKIPQQLLNCNFDGTECYESKVVPSITEISAHSGWIGGGQDLVITGTSLDDPEAVVEVDGVPCKVKSATSSKIVCSTGEKVEDEYFEAPERYAGSNGLKVSHYKGYKNTECCHHWIGDAESYSTEFLMNYDWHPGMYTHT